MTLHEYFQSATGKGILASADEEGKVDATIYSRPHILEDAPLAFIMRDSLTHQNVEENAFATYLFIEVAEAGRKRKPEAGSDQANGLKF